MKIYLVSRTDGVDYDEYDALVIRAKNPKHALDIASGLDEHMSEPGWPWYVYSGMGNRAALTVSEVTSDGKPGVILGSYNAG